MADADKNGANNPGAGSAGAPAAGSQDAAAAAKVPSFRVVNQYIKDLSFENPNAPRSFSEKLPGGGIKLQINVNVRQLAPDVTWEVELAIEARAGTEDKVVFNLELVYAGVFRVENVAKESTQALVMIEGPRLLFPFARQILADATRSGGYAPLMLDPIDFTALYRQRLQKAQADAQASSSPQV